MAEMGRPPMYKTVEELDGRAVGYFTWIEGDFIDHPGDDEKGEAPWREWLRRPEPPTITGLTLFLGFDSRQSFYDYCDKSDEFAYALKRHRTRIECCYEQNLHGTTPTGSIFALKNMGWKDKSEQEYYGKDGKPIETTQTIKIIRDTSTGIAPSEFTPESKTGTSAE
jgi:hypothetical protein